MSDTKSITIIGNGGWGTALGIVLANAGHRVCIWGVSEEEIAEIRGRGQNSLYLPGVELPGTIEWTSDAHDAVASADLAIIAAPSKFYQSVMDKFRGTLPPQIRLVSVSKGFDRARGGRLSALAERTLERSDVAVLSGPSHAEEVALGIPSAVVLAARDHALAQELQAVICTESFRVYTSEDVVGVELGGALKNVIAIAVGTCDGLGFGDNTRAALITRGLAEMTRLGLALGARAETFSGLSGLGDLVVTCTSQHSRNRGVGERLGHGETIEEITDGMKQVAEGVENCDIALQLARDKNVDVPITHAVHAVIHKECSPQDAVRGLMLRDAKPEAE